MRQASLATLLSFLVVSTAQAMETTSGSYTCARGVVVPYVYVNDEGDTGIAIIQVEGRMINLVAERSGSGVRYGWPSDGSHYVWWTKGNEATLYWRDGETGDETAILENCLAD